MNFDGDGKSDVPVWQDDTTGNWLVQRSSGGTQTQLDWGKAALGDIAIPGNYDGDTKTDYAVWRPSEGNWHIIGSQTTTVLLRNLGQSTDVPVPSAYIPQ